MSENPLRDSNDASRRGLYLVKITRNRKIITETQVTFPSKDVAKFETKYKTFVLQVQLCKQS